MMSAVPAYLAMSDLGFGTAARNRMTIEVGRGDSTEATRTYQSAWALVAFVTAMLQIFLATAILLLPTWILENKLDVPAVEVRYGLLILTSYALLSLQGNLIQAPLVATGRYATAVVLQSLTALAEGLVTIFLVSFSIDFVTLAFALLVIRFSALTSTLVLVRRIVHSPRLGILHIRMQRVRELWSPALAVLAIPISQALMLQGTALVVGFSANPAAVPVFTAVRTLVRTGVQAATLVNHAVMPEMSTAIGLQDRELQRSFVQLTVRISLVVGLSLALILLIAGDEILWLWTGGNIVPPDYLLFTMVGVMLFNVFWHPLSNLLLAANCQASFSYIYLASCLLTVAFSYPAVLHFGLVGIGLVLLLADMVMMYVVFQQVRAFFYRG